MELSIALLNFGYAVLGALLTLGWFFFTEVLPKWMVQLLLLRLLMDQCHKLENTYFLLDR